MEEGERDLEGREKLSVSTREIKRYDDRERERERANCERAISKRERDRKKKRKEGG